MNAGSSSNSACSVTGSASWPAADALGAGLEDAGVHRLVEVLGAQELADPVIDLVVDEDAHPAGPARLRCCAAGCGSARVSRERQAPVRACGSRPCGGRIAHAGGQGRDPTRQVSVDGLADCCGKAGLIGRSIGGATVWPRPTGRQRRSTSCGSPADARTAPVRTGSSRLVSPPTPTGLDGPAGELERHPRPRHSVASADLPWRTVRPCSDDPRRRAASLQWRDSIPASTPRAVSSGATSRHAGSRRPHPRASRPSARRRPGPSPASGCHDPVPRA